MGIATLGGGWPATTIAEEYVAFASMGGHESLSRGFQYTRFDVGATSLDRVLLSEGAPFDAQKVVLIYYQLLKSFSAPPCTEHGILAPHFRATSYERGFLVKRCLLWVSFSHKGVCFLESCTSKLGLRSPPLGSGGPSAPWRPSSFSSARYWATTSLVSRISFGWSMSKRGLNDPPRGSIESPYQ